MELTNVSEKEIVENSGVFWTGGVCVTSQKRHLDTSLGQCVTLQEGSLASALVLTQQGHTHRSSDVFAQVSLLEK